MPGVAKTPLLRAFSKAIGGGRPEPLWEPRRFEGAQFYFAAPGTLEGAPVPEFDEEWRLKGYKPGADGALLISRVDQKFLKGLAQTFHGSYQRIQGRSDLNILARSPSLQSRESETEADVSWAFWLGSFLLLTFFLKE